jgi:hypothetical protein
MRRLAVLVPILVLAGALLARRRRRARAARAPLGPPEPRAVAPLEPGDRFVSVPWALVAAPQDRAELTIGHAGGAGMELDRVDAQETPTQVFVTVLMRRRRAAGPPVERPQLEAAVALSRPLGARELVHAPVDLPAPAGDGASGPPLYP